MDKIIHQIDFNVKKHKVDNQFNTNGFFFSATNRFFSDESENFSTE